MRVICCKCWKKNVKLITDFYCKKLFYNRKTRRMNVWKYGICRKCLYDLLSGMIQNHFIKELNRIRGLEKKEKELQSK